jgi:ribosomal protein S8E
MSCIDCSPETQMLGASPANIHWNVVRGDTAKIRITFFESNEVTQFDTEGWTYLATAYNPATNTYDELTVVEGDNYVDIIASPEISNSWGTAVSGTVAELSFDLEITIPAVAPETEDTIWTPVIGTISVMGDITRGL